MTTALSLSNQRNQVTEFSQTELELLQSTICKGSTPEEFKLFVQVAKHSGLDPFARQIHAVKRWDTKANREVMSIQTSVDGFRLIAQRTGDYEGQTAPQWCGPDMIWRDVWLEDDLPSAARVGVRRKGFHEPAWGIARWKSYAQSGKNGLMPMWAKMPDVMLAKCAECLALRKAFPQEMNGIYADEEMPVPEVKQVKAATVSGEVKTAKPKWTAEQTTRGGELRAKFQKIGGDAWLTDKVKQMAYDDPADVISAVEAVEKKWLPDQLEVAAASVETIHAAGVSSEMDRRSRSWDWSDPLAVIDELNGIIRSAEAA